MASSSRRESPDAFADNERSQSVTPWREPQASVPVRTEVDAVVERLEACCASFGARLRCVRICAAPASLRNSDLWSSLPEDDSWVHPPATVVRALGFHAISPIARGILVAQQDLLALGILLHGFALGPGGTTGDEVQILDAETGDLFRGSVPKPTDSVPAKTSDPQNARGALSGESVSTLQAVSSHRNVGNVEAEGCAMTGKSPAVSGTTSEKSAEDVEDGVRLSRDNQWRPHQAGSRTEVRSVIGKHLELRAVAKMEDTRTAEAHSFEGLKNERSSPSDNSHSSIVPLSNMHSDGVHAPPLGDASESGGSQSVEPVLTNSRLRESAQACISKSVHGLSQSTARSASAMTRVLSTDGPTAAEQPPPEVASYRVQSLSARDSDETGVVSSTQEMRNGRFSPTSGEGVKSDNLDVTPDIRPGNSSKGASNDAQRLLPDGDGPPSGEASSAPEITVSELIANSSAGVSVENVTGMLSARCESSLSTTRKSHPEISTDHQPRADQDLQPSPPVQQPGHARGLHGAETEGDSPAPGLPASSSSQLKASAAKAGHGRSVDPPVEVDGAWSGSELDDRAGARVAGPVPDEARPLPCGPEQNRVRTSLPDLVVTPPTPCTKRSMVGSDELTRKKSKVDSSMSSLDFNKDCGPQEKPATLAASDSVAIEDLPSPETVSASMTPAGDSGCRERGVVAPLKSVGLTEACGSSLDTRASSRPAECGSARPKDVAVAEAGASSLEPTPRATPGGTPRGSKSPLLPGQVVQAVPERVDGMAVRTSGHTEADDGGAEGVPSVPSMRQTGNDGQEDLGPGASPDVGVRALNSGCEGVSAREVLRSGGPGSSEKSSDRELPAASAQSLLEDTRKGGVQNVSRLTEKEIAGSNQSASSRCKSATDPDGELQESNAVAEAGVSRGILVSSQTGQSTGEGVSRSTPSVWPPDGATTDADAGDTQTPPAKRRRKSADPALSAVDPVVLPDEVPCTLEVDGPSGSASAVARSSCEGVGLPTVKTTVVGVAEDIAAQNGAGSDAAAKDSGANASEVFPVGKATSRDGIPLQSHRAGNEAQSTSPLVTSVHSVRSSGKEHVEPTANSLIAAEHAVPRRDSIISKSGSGADPSIVSRSEEVTNGRSDHRTGAEDSLDVPAVDEGSRVRRAPPYGPTTTVGCMPVVATALLDARALTAETEQDMLGRGRDAADMSARSIANDGGDNAGAGSTSKSAVMIPVDEERERSSFFDVEALPMGSARSPAAREAVPVRVVENALSALPADGDEDGQSSIAVGLPHSEEETKSVSRTDSEVARKLSKKVDEDAITCIPKPEAVEEENSCDVVDLLSDSDSSPENDNMQAAASTAKAAAGGTVPDEDSDLEIVCVSGPDI